MTTEGAQQVWIASDLHRTLKIEAAKRGVTMRALLEEAVREYLSKEVSDEMEAGESAPQGGT